MLLSVPTWHSWGHAWLQGSHLPAAQQGMGQPVSLDRFSLAKNGLKLLLHEFCFSTCTEMG